ncbi:beta-lactamase [candidate division TA06 bacterium DG_24]|uniref:MBL fold metallo-hydrolase n=2 Tax=Bacteria division TA06 TaxID=1156500 RepID=A0A0S8JKF5_UNCT6|nr:MAG: beta-lactamase [candidate division TA06 bacterium DG_24]KPL10122.1 MAG: MBL fold metallo-hydrolase [candidate division TA06 bacterium SM1_40]
MIFEQIMVGPTQANCYVVGCAETRVGAVVDPGDEAVRILSAVRRLDLEISYIINTHGHIDHIGANKELKEATDGAILIHRLDAPMLISPSRNMSLLFGKFTNSPPADRELEDGDTIEIGSLRLDVMHTPGHTPGGISLAGKGFVFTGDTLFAESIGRTDFPGGSYQQILRSIRERLLAFPDETEIYPGHGWTTTMADIRQVNPFVAEALRTLE